MKAVLTRVARYFKAKLTLSSPHIDEKRYGMYRGIVKDNIDPQKRGRVKLLIPALLGKQETDWALPCSPYGGANQQGLFMVPEIGARAWVEFEEGDISRPIWVGTFWQQESDTPEDAASVEPTTRLLQTRSGHILQFDDAEGDEQIRLYHPADAEIVIDSNGTLSFTDAAGSILRMDAENSEIRIEDSQGNTLNMNSSGTRVEDANGNTIEMSAGGIKAEAATITLKGDVINLGDAGGEPLIKGESFLNLFATHIHNSAPVVGGPTSPPVPQGESSSLSTIVKAT